MSRRTPEKLDPKDLVCFKELLIANSIQEDAPAQFLIERGVITEEEFYRNLKAVLADYLKKQSAKE